MRSWAPARPTSGAFLFEVENLLACFRNPMDQQLIQAVVAESNAKLVGRFLGKIFQLSQFSFVLDFGLRSEFLFISIDPSSPRFYLIARRAKDLEKQSVPLSHFGQLLRARLGGGRLNEVAKDMSDRIVRLTFQIEDELGTRGTRHLMVQLTGKAANLLILDEAKKVTEVSRPPKGKGQVPGDEYEPPPHTQYEGLSTKTELPASSASAAADEHFSKLDEARSFSNRVAGIRASLQKEIAKTRRLKANLLADLNIHGDPEQHKRLGDLLLANIGSANRAGRRTVLKDYYSAGNPLIEIEIDENTSLQEEAAKRFRQYTKAKRAREEIAERLKQLDVQLGNLQQKDLTLDRIIQTRDEDALTHFDKVSSTKKIGQQARRKRDRIPGVRQYVSSDGYDVWVGRAARDNDNLTFRLANPHDLWLHAGDYPGSHVIIRNPSRKEVPQRTLIEAAQLAGRFSQASEDSKVVVHYTERRFLSKPKGAAPGLVRMSSFRSITVEPKESIGRFEGP